ncbi:hypothetical protein Cal7507_0045 [Calothrix sp. PCC 7507]|nr:hypothetical protein Cal7507_0045 [Calothrix sp. PCC 7507]
MVLIVKSSLVKTVISYQLSVISYQLSVTGTENLDLARWNQSRSIGYQVNC